MHLISNEAKSDILNWISTGEMTFNDEHNLECKPMTLIEILNNPYHFKMTISPNKQIDLKKMAVKQIKCDWATGNRSLQKTLNGEIQI